MKQVGRRVIEAAVDTAGITLDTVAPSANNAAHPASAGQATLCVTGKSNRKDCDDLTFKIASTV